MMHCTARPLGVLPHHNQAFAVVVTDPWTFDPFPTFDPCPNNLITGTNEYNKAQGPHLRTPNPGFHKGFTPRIWYIKREINLGLLNLGFGVPKFELWAHHFRLGRYTKKWGENLILTKDDIFFHLFVQHTRLIFLNSMKKFRNRSVDHNSIDFWMI
jgi:hypothetical protein